MKQNLSKPMYKPIAMSSPWKPNFMSIHKRGSRVVASRHIDVPDLSLDTILILNNEASSTSEARLSVVKKNNKFFCLFLVKEKK